MSVESRTLKIARKLVGVISFGFSRKATNLAKLLSEKFGHRWNAETSAAVAELLGGPWPLSCCGFFFTVRSVLLKPQLCSCLCNLSFGSRTFSVMYSEILIKFSLSGAVYRSALVASKFTTSKRHASPSYNNFSARGPRGKMARCSRTSRAEDLLVCRYSITL